MDKPYLNEKECPPERELGEGGTEVSGGEGGSRSGSAVGLPVEGKSVRSNSWRVGMYMKDLIVTITDEIAKTFRYDVHKNQPISDARPTALTTTRV